MFQGSVCQVCGQGLVGICALHEIAASFSEEALQEASPVGP